MEVFSFDTLLSLGVGLSLATACGFRVFIPMLVMSIAALSGHITLSSNFEWIASYPALLAFGVATIVEIAGNAIPAVGTSLKLLETPVSLIAGTLVTAASVTTFPPYLQWTLAIIVGGGSAGVVHGATTMLRAPAHAAAPGVADTGVSAAEAGGSFLLSILAVLLPIIALILAIAGLLLVFYFAKALMTRWRNWRNLRGSVGNNVESSK